MRSGYAKAPNFVRTLPVFYYYPSVFYMAELNEMQGNVFSGYAVS